MLQAPTFDLTTLSLETPLWLGLAFALVVFGVYSVVLLWHWKEYSMGKFTTVANMFVYVGVGVGLLVIMALSAGWYSAV